MTLQQIMARLAEINSRMAAIQTEAQNPETTHERMAALDGEVNTLVQEREELTRKSVQLRAQAQNFAPVVSTPAAAPAVTETNERAADKYRTLEYRQAFMNWVLHRAESPLLARADASTTTDGIQSVIIPTTITDQLFLKHSNAGSLFARVTKTNYPAGMAIPLVNFKPELEWVSENGKSSRTKATTGSITFTGYKGQIRLAISLESQYMSLDQFEAALLERLLDACKRGFDKVIVNGTGTGQPTGILTGADYKTKAAQLNNKTISDYAEWIKIWAKIPLARQANSVLHINKTDWQSHVLGMKDETGRVIALDTIGFGGAPIHVFMGREVVLLEDQGLPLFDSITGNATASKATAFAYFVDDGDYKFNSNMQLTVRNYIDEETDEKIHKATIIADGKLADDESLLVICRGANATA